MHPVSMGSSPWTSTQKETGAKIDDASVEPSPKDVHIQGLIGTRLLRLFLYGSPSQQRPVRITWNVGFRVG